MCREHLPIWELPIDNSDTKFRSVKCASMQKRDELAVELFISTTHAIEKLPNPVDIDGPRKLTSLEAFRWLGSDIAYVEFS
ncbi:MAG: hypothetical protein DI533_06305 [Cereibacter sphaeroides]|uniref:Uncharacterized protein n=1 Tax=Cereibacter sphaeroides TaxID=1063 RepID=A0A2W5SB09_CERSP|nr:MAG: hypothetical protein DI533_06305 [Cereibacter sphaeroides]